MRRTSIEMGWVYLDENGVPCWAESPYPVDTWMMLAVKRG